MIDILFYSRTGTTKKVAEILFEELSKCADVNLIEIRTKRDHRYLTWLLLSFIPNLGVGITHDEVKATVVFLCMPKWTINCPPVTSFLRSRCLKGKSVYVIITYGGFDGERYAVSYRKKIEKVSRSVREVILVKRDFIKGKNDLKKVRELAVRMIEGTEMPEAAP